MQLFGAITTIIAAATSVSALPRPDLAKRDVGGVSEHNLIFPWISNLYMRPDTNDTLQVLMCQGANATGYCQYRVWAIDECHDVPEPWFRNVKTFLVDGDDFYCWPRV